MNKHMSLIAGLALAATAWGAGVQTQPQPQGGAERVTVPGPLLKIELPVQPYWMDRDRFEELRGAYQLSNGQTLYLTRGGYTMYAEIDGQGRHPVVASGRSSFVATDLKLKVRIDWHGDGSVGGEVVMVVPRRDMASGAVTEELVALVMN
ncbi:hypothetical protein [Pseudoduganella sp. UC29_71]|uniref:hypothetical protein n=1 Tax=Pseudoduganella sp. UC29_71 TaxID=3350174 RepID=UPI0036730EFD